MLTALLILTMLTTTFARTINYLKRNGVIRLLYEIVKEFPNEIIYEEKGPFISLYQPTHRYRPENEQDVIRFKNLITAIENSLKQEYPESDIESLMKPFNTLLEDKLFWNNTTDGLAILANEDKCIIYKLQLPVKELSVVGEKFHIKPLIRYFQSADRYLLLGLDRKQFTLYEGNRYGFEKIELDPDIPTTIEEVLGDEYPKPYLSQGSYDGAGGTPMFHGHGGKKEEIKKNTDRYFRYVDKFILDNYSNPMKIPLILAGLDEHHGVFRNITSNHYLLDEGIKRDYKTLSKDQIRESAWNLIEPFYLEKTKGLIDRYNVNRSKFLASDDLSEVSRAVFENRVDTIMMEADRTIPGMIDKETGKLKRGDLKEPEFDNVINDLATMVYKSKGEIVILPKERIPSITGVAAIFRY